jgi:hypothetical protein
VVPTSEPLALCSLGHPLQNDARVGKGQHWDRHLIHVG